MPAQSVAGIAVTRLGGCKGELRDGIAIAAIKKNGDDSTVKKKEGVLCRTDWRWL